MAAAYIKLQEQHKGQAWACLALLTAVWLYFQKLLCKCSQQTVMKYPEKHYFIFKWTEAHGVLFMLFTLILFTISVKTLSCSVDA